MQATQNSNPNSLDMYGYKLPITLIALGSLTLVGMIMTTPCLIMQYGIAQQSAMAFAQLGCTVCIPVSAAAAIIAHCSNSPKARSCSLALLGLSLSSALILHAIQFYSLDSAGLSNTLGGMILQSSGTAVSDLNVWKVIGTEAGIGILPTITIFIGLGMALNRYITKAPSTKAALDLEDTDSSESINNMDAIRAKMPAKRS